MVIEPDQALEERNEMEFDNEGNLIDKSQKKQKRRPKNDEESYAFADIDEPSSD